MTKILLIRGRSRIPHRRGQTGQGGANIQNCPFFPKTAWNQEHFGPWEVRGAGHAGCDLPKSAIIQVNS